MLRKNEDTDGYPNQADQKEEHIRSAPSWKGIDSSQIGKIIIVIEGVGWALIKIGEIAAHTGQIQKDLDIRRGDYFLGFLTFQSDSDQSITNCNSGS